MDCDAPQQCPLQNRHNRVKAQKLRMSCDACSSSKIKCDQSRPICCRCQKLNLKCNYSPSRRMGKPPAASRDLAKSAKDWKTQHQRQASKSSSSDEFESLMRASQNTSVESIDQVDPNFPALMDVSMPVYEDITTASWQSFMADGGDSSNMTLPITTPNHNFDQDFSSIDTSAISHFTVIESVSDMLDFDDEFTDPFDVEPQCRQQQSHDSPNLNPNNSNSNSNSSNHGPKPSDPLPTPPYNGDFIDDPFQSYNCTSLASLTLYSLNLDSKTCKAFHTPAYPQAAAVPLPTCNGQSSIDQILITNKAAVENVSAILACPCSLSHQSSIILALIIDKIIARYQALIRDDISSSSSACSTDSLLRATPITLGAYRMDAEDEQRMRIQLVSNELRKAMALVKKHSDRYADGCNGEVRGEDGGIYATLTIFLRGRLNEAMKETVRALRGAAVD